MSQSIREKVGQRWLETEALRTWLNSISLNEATISGRMGSARRPRWCNSVWMFLSLTERDWKEGSGWRRRRRRWRRRRRRRRRRRWRRRRWALPSVDSVVARDGRLISSSVPHCDAHATEMYRVFTEFFFYRFLSGAVPCFSRLLTAPALDGCVPWWIEFYRVLPSLIHYFYRFFCSFVNRFTRLLDVPSFDDYPMIYRVSPYFTEFYRVLPVFLVVSFIVSLVSWSHHDLMTTYHELPSFTVFYRALPSFTEFYRVLPTFNMIYRVLPSLSSWFTGKINVFSLVLVSLN